LLQLLISRWHAIIFLLRSEQFFLQALRFVRVRHKMKDCDAESISRSLCSSSNDRADFKREMLGVLLRLRHVGIEHLLNDVSCNVVASLTFVLGDEALRLVFDVLFPWLDDDQNKQEWLQLTSKKSNMATAEGLVSATNQRGIASNNCKMKPKWRCHVAT
jgi:hypothetical protein